MKVGNRFSGGGAFGTVDIGGCMRTAGAFAEDDAPDAPDASSSSLTPAAIFGFNTK